MAQRKCWHHDPLPEGWVEIAHERFDYVECAIFEKVCNEADLSKDERQLLAWHGTPPDGWLQPDFNDGYVDPFPEPKEKPKKEDLLHVLESLGQISEHADRIIGRGEFRRYDLTTFERGSRSSYERRRISSIPGCSHLLYYDSKISGVSIYYHLSGDNYLRVSNA